MFDWLPKANDLYNEGQPFVIATLWSLQGSSPDAAGHRILVSVEQTAGRFNSGARQRNAVSHARRLLRDQTQQTVVCDQLGEVAGTANGSSTMVYSHIAITDARPDWLLAAINHQKNNTPAVLAHSIIQKSGTAHSQLQLFTADNLPADSNRAQQILHLLNDKQSSVTADHETLLQLIGEPTTTVAVIGDGKVATALVSQLALLPINVIWLAQKQPQSNQHRVTCLPLDEKSISRLPVRTFVAIATGNHQADQQYCKLALNTPLLPYVGCIGSHKKAQIFKSELALDGVDQTRLNDLHMPIGLKSIAGKQPEIVAASIVGQVLSLRDQSH